MPSIIFEDILHLTEQLSPEEQDALVTFLQSKRSIREPSRLDLLVFDVGPWPEQMTLRREDEYDNDGR